MKTLGYLPVLLLVCFSTPSIGQDAVEKAVDEISERAFDLLGPGGTVTTDTPLTAPTPTRIPETDGEQAGAPEKAEPSRGICERQNIVWRSLNSRDPTSYQQLEFLTGSWNGDVRLSEYRNNELAWSSDGLRTCSNGAVRCYLEFPTMTGGEITLPFVSFDDQDNSYLAVPTFRQSVYDQERDHERSGLKYGGLEVSWMGDFYPRDGEIIAPHNVYKFSECAPLSCDGDYYWESDDGIILWFRPDMPSISILGYYYADPAEDRSCTFGPTGNPGVYSTVCKESEFSGLISLVGNVDAPTGLEWGNRHFEKKCVINGEYPD